MEPLIKIQNLTVGYDKTPVLQNVSLEIFENDFLGVIESNGGGKTTLIKAILGLLVPMEGKIDFRSDINGNRKPIGYLPQVKHIDRKFPITFSNVVKSGLMMQNGSVTSNNVKYVKTIACVNGNLHYHPCNRITQKDLDEYNCPIQIIKYGEVPHIILKYHHE